VGVAISKKKLLVGLGVVVLLGAAAGAGVLLQMYQRQQNPQSADTQKKLPDSVSSAQDLYQAGNAAEANKKINDALNNSSTSNDDKYLLYLSQANFATDKQDYQTAIGALLKAEAIKQTFEVATRLGAAYQQVGDNAKAIDYYKKAIQRNTDDSNPLRERQNDMYTELIKQLGGQP
jgi:tetratricopeptide (TPR) repeat protein